MSDNYDIILVEDNAYDAELAIRALRKGHISNSLLHLQNGKQALDYIFAEGWYSARDILEIPKVVLLDLKMPLVNGLEVLKRIKSSPGTRSIPVVLLTSSREEKDIRDSYNLGANSYIVKPVEFDSFQRLIADVGTYWLMLNQYPR